MSVFNHSFGDGPLAATPRYIHPQVDGLRLLNLNMYEYNFRWIGDADARQAEAALEWRDTIEQLSMVPDLTEFRSEGDSR